MPVYLPPGVKDNITKKLLHHLECVVDEGQLKISIFSNRDPVSSKLWKGMFNARINYVTKFPLIPVPNDYLPERYHRYADRLYEFIRDFFETRNVLESNYWGIFNLGEKKDPKFHLVITTRYLKVEELGAWLADIVPSKYLMRRMRMKRCWRSEPQRLDESLTSLEAPSEAAPLDLPSSSSGISGQALKGPSGQNTVPLVEEVRMDHVSASPISDSEEERPGSNMSGYMADSGSSESSPEQVVVPGKLLFYIRNRVYEALVEIDS